MHTLFGTGSDETTIVSFVSVNVEVENCIHLQISTVDLALIHFHPL